jgi:hypothetical protein
MNSFPSCIQNSGQTPAVAVVPVAARGSNDDSFGLGTGDGGAAMTAGNPARCSDTRLGRAGLGEAPQRSTYIAALTWAFTLFNTARVLAYLPTMWAIYVSGDSSQHSLWTWVTWMGANATMAAWLYEGSGRRLERAIIVNIGNATMCLGVTLLILAHRF